MKKKILLLGVLITILFSSCSGSDDATSTTDVLIKKIIETDMPSGKISTTNVLYDGKKIISVITERENYRQETKFTYTRDLITKSEEFFNDQLTITYIYEYNSKDQLILYKSTDTRPDPDYVTKKEYTYNINGTVVFNEYEGFVPNEDKLINSGIIYFSNDEISKIDILNTITNTTTTVTSEYDTKNSPYINITGFNKINIVNGRDNKHNLVRRIQTDEGFPEANNTLSIEYSYDANNYPINTTVSITANGNVAVLSTIQYFY